MDDRTDSDGARAALEQLETDVDQVVVELLPGLGDALGVEASAGQANYLICGMEPAPSGARYSSRPQFRGVPTSEEDAIENAAGYLESAGWEVERTANPLIVLATRDDVEVRVQAGVAATSVRVASPCVDSSSDLAREFADRPSKDVPLP